MRPLLLSFCLILLTGCTTMADRLHGSLVPPHGMGNVVLSLTGKAYQSEQAMVGISLSDEQGRIVAQDSASLSTDTIFGEPGKSMAEGKLLLFTLPPGQYRLDTVWGRWREELPFSIGYTYRSFSIQAPFVVEPGQTLYLGQAELEMSFLPKVTLDDEHGRDFAHMRRIWQINDLSAVVSHPLGVTP